MRPFSRRRYDLNHFEWLEQFELLKRLEPFERSEQYDTPEDDSYRSEEHTSELQSQSNLVCRLLPEKTTRHPRARCYFCFTANLHLASVASTCPAHSTMSNTSSNPFHSIPTRARYDSTTILVSCALN